MPCPLTHGRRPRSLVAQRMAWRGLLAAVTVVAAVMEAGVAAQGDPPVPPYTKVIAPGTCSWYGECGFSLTGKPLNCLYNQPAILVR